MRPIHRALRIVGLLIAAAVLATTNTAAAASARQGVSQSISPDKRQVGVYHKPVLAVNAADPSILWGGAVASPARASAQARPRDAVGGDEFNSPTLSPDWTVIGADTAHWSLTQRPGFLTITTQDADLYEGDNRPTNLFLRAAPAGDFEVSTRVLFAPRQDYEAVDLLLYRDPDNYIELSDAHQGGQAFLAGIEVNGHYKQ